MWKEGLCLPGNKPSPIPVSTAAGNIFTPMQQWSNPLKMQGLVQTLRCGFQMIIFRINSSL